MHTHTHTHTQIARLQCECCSSAPTQPSRHYGPLKPNPGDNDSPGGRLPPSSPHRHLHCTPTSTLQTQRWVEIKGNTYIDSTEGLNTVAPSHIEQFAFAYKQKNSKEYIHSDTRALLHNKWVHIQAQKKYGFSIWLLSPPSPLQI